MTSFTGGITSTVPGAIGVLLGYMNAVADQNTSLAVKVSLGRPVTSATANNLMMVGDYEEGAFITPGTYTWAAIPGQAKLRYESYALQGCIRTFSGSADGTAPLDRLTEAFALLNGLHQQIVNDLGGSGQLTPSGSWGEFEVSMPETGLLDADRGWGVVLGFQLHVINVQLIG